MDILIVDDEADIRALIRAILEDEGYQVREAENSQTALKHIEERTPDLAILDIWLQESDDDGIEILKHIKAGHPLTPVLMISGHGTIETAVNAIKLGAYDFIEKPFKSDRLQKDFREDLYYRLNVVTINVPPLKKRVNDIRDLSDFFLSSFAEQTGQPKRRLSSEAISNLELYEWPGNVRQLKNMMEWLTIMAPKPDKKKVLGITDLPPEFSGSQGKNRQKTDNFNFLGQSLREAREEFEKTYLKAQIKRFNGNISKTAQFIGMERSALHRKLKSLDISINEAQNGESNIKKLPLTA